MPSIHLRDLSLAAPDGRELVSHLTLSFGPSRTGLVGRNGTGKTTLLRAISGDFAPRAGSITVDGSIGVLRQAVRSDQTTVADTLGVTEALDRLARIESGGARDDDLEVADWSLPARIPPAIAEFGLPDLELSRPVATLSGGQRVRLSLAALLLGGPDILLLDEPTNNLDSEGREAVRNLLRRWHGAALVVSHDRELLQEMDEIVELTSVGTKVYGGNWDAYQARRALDLAAAEHEVAHAHGRLAQIERKAQERAERKSRNDSRGDRKAARGGLPRILLGAKRMGAEESGGAQARLADKQRAGASMDLAAAKAQIEVLAPLSVALEPTGLPAGRIVLQMEGVSGGPTTTPIIRNFSLTITGPERVALTGPNGVGKTTLLHLAAGSFRPVKGGAYLTPRHAFLDQEASLLDPALSVRDNYRQLNPSDSENQCRAALARFKFRAEAAMQTVGSLSGGELLRAALAATIGSGRPPELLLLDEPTNHLDLDAIQAVEAGLLAYDGALLVVSHDASFLDAIGITKCIALK